MIHHKTNAELKRIRKSCKITAATLDNVEQYLQEGITTLELDKICYDFIKSKKAIPSFLNFRAGSNVFKHSICVSINEEIVHGIPKKRKLKNGDIVSIDVGVFYKGFHGDSCRTFAIGDISEKAAKLMSITKECLNIGIKECYIGNRLFNIGKKIQTFATSNGFAVVKDFTGHGVGKQLHEEPVIYHYFDPILANNYRIREGLVVAIEPMINEGTWRVYVKQDGWTAVTRDRKLSAQYEHTIAVGKDGPEILTTLD